MSHLVVNHIRVGCLKAQPLRLPTPAFDIALNIAIEFDGSSHFLCYASEDGSLVNDNWYQTLEEAEQAAVEDFGVRADQWQTIG